MAEQTDVSPEKSKNGWQALVATVAGWPLSRKIALAAVTVISVALFAFIIVQARTADYQLLYGNLAESDASAMVEWLKGQNIPYQLGSNGRNILIPANQVHETRLSLASAGLPQGGGVGFEIFDKQSFALTDFVQKVNFSRALQGELARTITSLGPVESARVHLALPERRLFKEQQQPATASIIIKLAPGKRLGEAQIEGIVHLVSSSVEGLNPDQVTIIDQNGNVLSQNNRSGLAGNISPDMLEYQAQVEQRMEDRAQALLDKSLGPKNAMVRVTATLDFARTEKTEEAFDPDEPVIRSEQVTDERSGSAVTGGVPGVQSNMEGNSTNQTTGTPPTSKSQRTTNYEISKVVSKTTNPVGTVSKLSISVLIADRVKPAQEKEPAQTEPRSEAELLAVENMVASALGLDKARGDKIEVTSMPFLQTADSSDELGIASGTVYQYLPFIRYGLLILGAALLYFLMIRPLMKTLNKDITQHYKTVEQMEAEQAQGSGVSADAAMDNRPKDPLQKIKNDVESDPVFSAHVLKNWIQDRG
jgi:flagellar M-ring protein FliF